MSHKLVAVNDDGLLIGEDHPRAKLTDAQVDEMRDLHEDHGWGMRRLARRFNCALSTAHAICTYQSRAQRPAGWKRIGAKLSVY